MKRFLTVTCLAGCIAGSLGVAAVAQPEPWSPGHSVSQTVRLDDVDLHTQAGAKIVGARIRRAAIYVCGGDNTLWRQDFDFGKCRDGAIDRALASLQSPLVSASLGRQTPTGMASR